jgi:Flp pilus assembly protein protease CpaA
LGWHDLAPFLLGTVICGGVIGIVVASLHGRLRATVVNLQAMALPMLAGGPLAPVSQGTKMPYGLAIFAGASIVAGIHFFHARPLP